MSNNMKEGVPVSMNNPSHPFSTPQKKPICSIVEAQVAYQTIPSVKNEDEWVKKQGEILTHQSPNKLLRAQTFSFTKCINGSRVVEEEPLCSNLEQTKTSIGSMKILTMSGKSLGSSGLFGSDRESPGDMTPINKQNSKRSFRLTRCNSYSQKSSTINNCVQKKRETLESVQEEDMQVRNSNSKLKSIDPKFVNLKYNDWISEQKNTKEKAERKDSSKNREKLGEKMSDTIISKVALRFKALRRTDSNLDPLVYRNDKGVTLSALMGSQPASTRFEVREQGNFTPVISNFDTKSRGTSNRTSIQIPLTIGKRNPSSRIERTSMAVLREHGGIQLSRLQNRTGERRALERERIFQEFLIKAISS